MQIFVETSDRCNRHRGTGDWPSWRNSHDASIIGVERRESEKHTYGNTFNVDIEEGKIAYVVYMTYDSGDSFGVSTNKLDVLAVFESKQDAKKALAHVKGSFDEHNDSNTYDFTFIDSKQNHKAFKVRNPANGYFENFRDVELKGFVVT